MKNIDIIIWKIRKNCKKHKEKMGRLPIMTKQIKSLNMFTVVALRYNFLFGFGDSDYVDYKIVTFRD